MKRTLLVFLFAAVAAGGRAYSHHSFAAHYFEDQTVSITGDVVEFEYRNPHAWVHLDVEDEQRQIQRFAAEWGSIERLRRQGIRPDTLKPGDRVIITGSPGRNPAERKVHLKGIERPADGWKWVRR